MSKYEQWLQDNLENKLNESSKYVLDQINYKLAGKDSKLTPSKCYYMTKNRVNETLLYVEKKFYRLLKEILNDKD